MTDDKNDKPKNNVVPLRPLGGAKLQPNAMDRAHQKLRTQSRDDGFAIKCADALMLAAVALAGVEYSAENELAELVSNGRDDLRDLWEAAVKNAETRLRHASSALESMSYAHPDIADLIVRVRHEVRL